MNKKIKLTSNEQDSITIIGKNFAIKGDVISNTGDVDILGIVNGNCKIKKLLIREDGVLNGNIKSEHLIIQGRVNGNIDAEKVSILATGRVFGDIFYKVLKIEDGAMIEGSVKKNNVVVK
jgi:cytoskeletal protein CcmA (bactofilin family)